MADFNSPNIYLVAGEPSGDILGDQLIKELSKRFNSPKFYGVGGSKMKENDFESLFNMNEITFFGILPVLKKLFFLVRRINVVVNDILEKKPDIVILIDSPDFNHRVAKKVKKRLPNLNVVCYVAPSVWAWRQGRAKKMSKYFTHLLSIIPFEVEFFNKYGLKTTYVGHPVTEILNNLKENSLEEKYHLNDEKLVIYLPGSRKGEIERHSSVMMQSINELKMIYPEINILIIASSNQIELIKNNFPNVQIVSNDNDKFLLFKKADIACAASGTVTLELGICETPTIVTYKMDNFTWFFVSRLVKVKFVSLVNLILGKESSKELLQNEFSSDNIVKEIKKLITDSEVLNKQNEDLKQFKSLMYTDIKNPSEKASEVIKNIIVDD